MHVDFCDLSSYPRAYCIYTYMFMSHYIKYIKRIKTQMVAKLYLSVPRSKIKHLARIVFMWCTHDSTGVSREKKVVLIIGVTFFHLYVYSCVLLWSFTQIWIYKSIQRSFWFTSRHSFLVHKILLYTTWSACRCEINVCACFHIFSLDPVLYVL